MAPGAIVNVAPVGHDVHSASIVTTSPLSVNGVPSRRAKAPKISGAVAAHASSSMFKRPSTKPLAKRWDHRLSVESLSRGGSTLKNAIKYLKDPKVISLGGGLPTPDYFPFDSLSIKVPKPPKFSPRQTDEEGQTLVARKHDYKEGKSLYDISIAFNYGQATGAAQLLRFVTEHTEIVHNPPYEDWACSLTCGSTSSLDMVMRMFCERGHTILCEEFTFVSAVETAKPMGIHVAGVKMDEQGMRADSMDEVLENWDERTRGSPKPFVVYTIPSGQNPTGATQDLQRRRDIYVVCQKHDVIIIEDEPYYFLQMDPYKSNSGARQSPQATSHEDFLKALIPSFLSLDTDGRVLRLDSFSKVLAPGSRVGWITATEQLVERFVRHGEVSTQNPSGIAQLALYKLLEEGWGHEGYLDWLQWIRMEYTNRRDIMLRACEEFLPQEVASWTAPMAGMFHWIRIDWRKHPQVKSGPTGANGVVDGEKKTTSETEQMLQLEEQIFLDAVSEGALMARGSWFRAEQDGGTDMFFRATFASAGEDQIREAIRRVGIALRKSFEIKE